MEPNSNKNPSVSAKKSAKPKITVFTPPPGQEHTDAEATSVDSAILTETETAEEALPDTHTDTERSAPDGEAPSAAPVEFNVGLTVSRHSLSAEPKSKNNHEKKVQSKKASSAERPEETKKSEKKKKLRVIHGAPPKRNNSDDKEENDFLRMAKRLRIVKYGVGLCLVAFVCIMLTFFSDAITMENLRYMARYLDIGSSYSGFSDDFIDLTYQTSTRHDFSVYRGDIAISNAVGLQIKSTTNRDIFSADLYYSYPVSCAGEKYLLVYDLGSTGYSVHNTFGTLYSGTADYNISAADMADNGTFALVTGSAQYRSEVRVYDTDFQVICSVKKDKTVIDINLSADGSRLLILSCGTADGSFYSEIMICNTKTGETEFSETLNNQFAVTSDLRTDGSFSVFCDSSILFYGADHSLIASYVPQKTPTAYCQQNGYTAFAVSHSLVGGDSTLTVLDTRGDRVCTAEITGKIIRMSAADNAICVLTADRLYYIPFRDGSVYQTDIDGSPSDFLLCSNAGGYICYPSGAKYVTFATAFSGSNASN